jgi:hypothetical protein
MKTRLERRGDREVFVINRKEWSRGKASTLWRSDEGRGCCLGLAALVEGVHSADMISCGTPASLMDVAPSCYLQAWVWNYDPEANELPDNNSAALRAMKANDSDRLPGAKREAVLASIFKQARGWDVEFED